MKFSNRPENRALRRFRVQTRELRRFRVQSRELFSRNSLMQWLRNHIWWLNYKTAYSTIRNLFVEDEGCYWTISNKKVFSFLCCHFFKKLIYRYTLWSLHFYGLARLSRRANPYFEQRFGRNNNSHSFCFTTAGFGNHVLNDDGSSESNGRPRMTSSWYSATVLLSSGEVITWMIAEFTN